MKDVDRDVEVAEVQQWRQRLSGQLPDDLDAGFLLQIGDDIGHRLRSHAGEELRADLRIELTENVGLVRRVQRRELLTRRGRDAIVEEAQRVLYCRVAVRIASGRFALVLASVIGHGALLCCCESSS